MLIPDQARRLNIYITPPTAGDVITCCLDEFRICSRVGRDRAQHGLSQQPFSQAPRSAVHTVRTNNFAGMGGRGMMGPPPPGGGRGGPPPRGGIDGAKWQRGLQPPPPPPGAGFTGPQHGYGRPAPSLHKTGNAYKVRPSHSSTHLTATRWL